MAAHKPIFSFLFLLIQIFLLSPSVLSAAVLYISLQDQIHFILIYNLLK